MIKALTLICCDIFMCAFVLTVLHATVSVGFFVGIGMNVILPQLGALVSLLKTQNNLFVLNSILTNTYKITSVITSFSYEGRSSSNPLGACAVFSMNKRMTSKYSTLLIA